MCVRFFLAMYTLKYFRMQNIQRSLIYWNVCGSLLLERRCFIIIVRFVCAMCVCLYMNYMQPQSNKIKIRRTRAPSLTRSRVRERE